MLNSECKMANGEETAETPRALRSQRKPGCEWRVQSGEWRVKNGESWELRDSGIEGLRDRGIKGLRD